MKRYLFVLVALLTLSNVTYGVVLDYEVNPDPGPGYKSYTVNVSGVGINELGKFRVTGDVYQVWTAPNTQSEWLHNANTPGDPMDSYIIFGEYSMGNLSNLETIYGSGLEGLGTLNNYNETTGEANVYLELGQPSSNWEAYDLLHLVVPTGEEVFVELDVYSCEYNPNSGYYDLVTQHEFFGEDGLTVGVPEPCTFALMLLGTLCLITRRVRGR